MGKRRAALALQAVALLLAPMAAQCLEPEGKGDI